ncbi:Asp-tRNA(Asn)/Glu-tRNA(Gln) amidotransferase subunit GatB [Candidatus Saccharibacteria bacterium]|nr:Asp-tRNA(Asn)/Glu-tRNA(Gln) amidotransferase subunit GatB [Candidatus Saccharibacteria bacterium]
MGLGSAGENGSLIDEKMLEKYLVRGYLPTIGIECHVQLATKTKLFSAVDNDARGSAPNAKVSAIDYALPGMLPYLNREAIVKAARAGKALNAEIAHESRFDRKHYFYPDLPKGYQISQMYQPIIIGGWVDLPSRQNAQSSEITIEKVDADSDDFAEIAREVRVGQFRERVRDGRVVLLAAKIDGKIVGRVNLWLDKWDDDDPNAGSDVVVTDFYPNLPAINALFVKKDFRKHGIASKLLETAENEALVRGFSEIGLSVEVENKPALKLYEKLHYKITPINGKKTYRCWFDEVDENGKAVHSDIDCYLMIKDLDSATDAQNDESIAPKSAVRIHHAHLEEDAGKLTHYGDHSLVDLNRAGTPLIEIVAEPDIHSAAEAREYAEELHGLMTYAGVTIGDLYHGNMRFDVNISVAEPGEKLGIRTEIKNLNSFRSVEKATEYEIARQIAILEKGEKITQETRGWLDDAQKTVSQRSKEDAQDYRYMPDADIPPVILTDAEIAEMQADMPILPPQYRAKFAALKVDESVVRTILRDQNIAKLLAEILDQAGADAAKRIANLFASTLPAEDENAGADDDLQPADVIASETKQSMDRHGDEPPRDDKFLPSAENLIKLADMLAKSEISSTAGKEIFVAILSRDADPRKIAESKNLLQVSDESAIGSIVDAVLADPACAKAVQDFKNGEEKVIGFLVGQVMKASKGQANPALAQKLIREKLGKIGE